MSKSTHLSSATVQNELRIGGVTASGLGGQPVALARVPTNWFPVNLPIASAATPQNSDCLTLLNALAKLVPLMTIQQSVVLANCYRTVQSGVVAGGTFTVNSIASATVTSWFDQSISIKETVPVDTINKNPTLTYDLALRLAVKAAAQIDKQLLALYAGFTSISAIGTQATTPTPANLATQIALLPVTGEPIFGAFTSQLGQTSSTLATVSTIAAMLGAVVGVGDQSDQNGNAPIFLPTTAARPIRLLASDNVKFTGTTTTTSHNVLWLPSGLAFATADQGTSLGSGGGVNPNSGANQSIVGGTYRDPETATPQLSLQFVIGNTGGGAQAVYVNCLGAGIVINVANGAVIIA